MDRMSGGEGERERAAPVQYYRSSRGFKPFSNPPQPHMCVQDSIRDTTNIIFVNVLSWNQISNLKQDPDPIPMFGGMQIPQAYSSNFNKPPLIVFAVMVHPEVLEKIGKNAINKMERDTFIDLIFDFVEAMNPGLRLTRNPNVLKDRDLAGELKDVWLAVQNRREREKAQNKKADSGITHKIYHIDGPPEVTNKQSDVNDIQNVQSRPADKMNAESNQRNDVSLENNMKKIYIDRDTESNNHNNYKSNNDPPENNKSPPNTDHNNEYRKSSDNCTQPEVSGVKCKVNENIKSDNISKCGESNVKCVTSQNTNNPNATCKPSNDMLTSSTDRECSKNDKNKLNGCNGKQQSPPSHIPVKLSRVKRKTNSRFNEEVTKTDNFYPVFENHDDSGNVSVHETQNLENGEQSTSSSDFCKSQEIKQKPISTERVLSFDNNQTTESSKPRSEDKTKVTVVDPNMKDNVLLSPK